MNILALSDDVVDMIYSIQARERFADRDLVIACGDLPYYYLEFVVTLLGKPVFYVHGNHDKMKQYRSDGRTLNHAEGCDLIDGRVHRHRDERGRVLLMAGLGGCMRYNQEEAYQYTQEEMNQRAVRLFPGLLFNRVRYGRFLDVLVTHSPPFGIHDAGDVAHTGFRAFLPFMRWFRPRLMLHGHVHNFSANLTPTTRYHKTTIMNVHPYRRIELEVGYDGF